MKELLKFHKVRTCPHCGGIVRVGAVHICG